jgi:hypothetical protein
MISDPYKALQYSDNECLTTYEKMILHNLITTVLISHKTELLDDGP